MSGQLSTSEKTEAILAVLSENISALEAFSGTETYGDVMLEHLAWETAEEYVNALPEEKLNELYDHVEKYNNDQSYSIPWNKYN